MVTFQPSESKFSIGLPHRWGSLRLRGFLFLETAICLLPGFVILVLVPLALWAAQVARQGRRGGQPLS